MEVSKRFILVAMVLAFQICQQCVALDELVLQSGEIKHLDLPKQRFVNISVADITNGTTYMLQLHSQIYNMTLCSSPIMTHEVCKNGTNVGMYLNTPKIMDNETAVVWYVRMNSTHNKTTVVVYLHSLQPHAPVPGGCNQVFNVEKDATMELTYFSHRTHLFYQWANEPVSGVEPDCDSDFVQSDLEYEVYVYFLGGRSFGLQSYLDGVSKMLKVSDIEDNAQKIETTQNEATVKPEIFIASEPSRGAIYSIVVKSKSTGLSSAYVTTVKYSCSFELETCSTSMSTGEIIIIIICFLVGLYLLFLGHRMFSMSQFVFGYVFAFFLVFLLMSMVYTVQRSVIFGIAGCMGVIGGGLCLLFWYCCFFPIASVIIPGICAGYLVSATLFFTPFGRIIWWESNENYILAFFCAVLTYAVLLMAFTKFLSILSCSLIGSYLVLMIIAVPLRLSLRLIYLYTEYRQTEQNFEKVKPVSPMAGLDIMSFVLWPVLLVLGVLFQYYREIGRPAFERLDLRKPEIRKRNINPGGEVDPIYETDTEDTDGDSSDEGEKSRLLPTRTTRSPRRQAVAPSRGSSGAGVGGTPSYQSVLDSNDTPRRMNDSVSTDA